MMKTENLKASIKPPQSEHWATLASFFEREGKPVSELTFTAEVIGVYSLPEDWIRREALPLENWQYTLKISDVNFDEGKYFPRELTDEEKKKIEDEKNNKNKKPPQGKQKVEEPSKEELERLEKERLLQEEIKRKKEEGMRILIKSGTLWTNKPNFIGKVKINMSVLGSLLRIIQILL